MHGIVEQRQGQLLEAGAPVGFGQNGASNSQSLAARRTMSPYTARPGELFPTIFCGIASTPPGSH
jgi:hypothetical protein